MIDPVFAKQGFSESDLILHWDDIVGERLGAGSRPIKLQWPPRPPGRHPVAEPQPATLVIRVESWLALDMQHGADQVLARVNAHLGWRCIGKLSFRQGPIERAESRADRRCRPSEAELAAAAVPGIEDDALRDALARLGAHVAR